MIKLKDYPELERQLDELTETWLDDILCEMLENDEKYKKLCREKASANIKLKESIKNSRVNTLFENYSDIACTQENYKLSAIYKQAVKDVFTHFVDA
ncbi:MAG: hypothetical protein LBR74_04790 [Eubacterium sp.]|nr:hypothetical protein [Eubacterium sp.]